MTGLAYNDQKKKEARTKIEQILARPRNTQQQLTTVILDLDWLMRDAMYREVFREMNQEKKQDDDELTEIGFC
jgi:hypothetical protein